MTPEMVTSPVGRAVPDKPMGVILHAGHSPTYRIYRDWTVTYADLAATSVSMSPKRS